MAGVPFVCPYCRSEYLRVEVTLSCADNDIALCAVCERVMDRWESRQVPLFRLVNAAMPAAPAPG